MEYLLSLSLIQKVPFSTEKQGVRLSFRLRVWVLGSAPCSCHMDFTGPCESLWE